MWRDMGSAVDGWGLDTVAGSRSGDPAALDEVLVCPGYEHAVRWRPGERLEQLFEQRCDWMQNAGRAGACRFFCVRA